MYFDLNFFFSTFFNFQNQYYLNYFINVNDPQFVNTFMLILMVIYFKYLHQLNLYFLVLIVHIIIHKYFKHINQNQIIL